MCILLTLQKRVYVFTKNVMLSWLKTYRYVCLIRYVKFVLDLWNCLCSKVRTCIIVHDWPWHSLASFAIQRILFWSKFLSYGNSQSTSRCRRPTVNCDSDINWPLREPAQGRAQGHLRFQCRHCKQARCTERSRILVFSSWRAAYLKRMRPSVIHASFRSASLITSGPCVMDAGCSIKLSTLPSDTARLTRRTFCVDSQCSRASVITIKCCSCV